MACNHAMVEDCLKKLNKWVVKRVPRKENLKVDALVGIASTILIRKIVMLPIYLQATPSIIPEPLCSANEANLGWMHDIVKYL